MCTDIVLPVRGDTKIVHVARRLLLEVYLPMTRCLPFDGNETRSGVFCSRKESKLISFTSGHLFYLPFLIDIDSP